MYSNLSFIMVRAVGGALGGHGYDSVIQIVRSHTIALTYILVNTRVRFLVYQLPAKMFIPTVCLMT